MKMRPKRILRFLTATARLGVIILLASVLFGQGRSRIGLPDDWTHRFVVFSNVNSPPDFVLQDPRFWLQYFKHKHHDPTFNQSTSPLSTLGLVRDLGVRNPGQFDPGNGGGKKDDSSFQDGVDWSVTLNNGNTPLNMYPAKYTFDVNAAPSCTNDFVVFALDVDGGSGQANLIGFNNLYTNPAGGGSCPGTGPSVKFAYNIGIGAGHIATSPVHSLDGTKVAFAETGVNPPVFHVLTIGTTGNNGTSATSAVVPGTGNNAVDVNISYGTGGNTRSSPFVDYVNDV
ncbi:MAG TPA: hypothetical protein VEO53_18650, partial [Candidatus Binatia bacterium]|nr:hypothetical protein [Candidatus Binatia bacterium]